MLLRPDELPVQLPAEVKLKPKLNPVAELSAVRDLIEGSLDHWFSLNPSRAQSLFVSSREFAASQKPPAWLVADIITELSLNAIVGPTGSYKSFLALDLATCVALGKPFHGRETKQANVLLILGEGAHGIPVRQKGLHADPHHE